MHCPGGFQREYSEIHGLFSCKRQFPFSLNHRDL